MLALFFALGRFLGAFGTSCCVCARSWTVFAPLKPLRARSGAHRARFWSGFGRFRKSKTSSWVWCPLGWLLASFWVLLGVSWPLMGTSWALLGRLLCYLGRLLAGLWRLLSGFCHPETPRTSISGGFGTCQAGFWRALEACFACFLLRLELCYIMLLLMQ